MLCRAAASLIGSSSGVVLVVRSLACGNVRHVDDLSMREVGDKFTTVPAHLPGPVSRVTTGQVESRKRSRPTSAVVASESIIPTTATKVAEMSGKPMQDSRAGPNFHSIKVGDTLFTVLKRYTDLASIGSGAQGVVW